ncbi:MAG TPA: S8 family serine peptidase [Longimicrobiales bacterium]
MERRSRRLSGAFLAATALAITACADDATTPAEPDVAAPSFAVAGGGSDFIVIARAEALPPDFEARMRDAGGVVRRAYPQVGVAVVRSADPAFDVRAAGVPGIDVVVPDLVIQWQEPAEAAPVLEAVAGGDVAETASLGDDETFFGLQWAPGAIHAPEAWAAGYTGRGVRVAVVDGGIYDRHVDLDDNLDVAASASFIPGFAFNEDVGTFWHGTHVAGIIAAEDNGIGTIGIAPEATIIGVKVLHDGSGPFSAVIGGIIYAATPVAEGGAGADIINLSLGALFDEKAKEFKHAAHDLMKAIDRATGYAHKRGVLVIGAAGNEAVDLDAMKTLTFTPAANRHVIAVAATGPLGWALGSTGFDRPASYTNFGRSLVDIAGPGGDFALPGDDLCAVPTLLGPIVQPCWVFDMVLSTTRGGSASTSSYSWAAGTSMAAPAVAGVAALLRQRYGDIPPAELQSRLLGSADGNGNNPFFGRGIVNALNAVR